MYLFPYRWLKKNDLTTRKLTILDALAPTMIPHTTKYVPILYKHVLSKVFDQVKIFFVVKFYLFGPSYGIISQPGSRSLLLIYVSYTSISSISSDWYKKSFLPHCQLCPRKNFIRIRVFEILDP